MRRALKKQTLTGIDRVSIAYIKHYQFKAQALTRYCGINVVLSLKNSQKIFTWLLSPAKKTPIKNLIIRSIFQNNIQRQSILLNTGHIGNDQKNYIKMLKKYNLKPIFFVHDLIPIYYPEYCSKGEDLRHQYKLNYILKYGYGIISNSKDTLEKLNIYCNTNKLPKLPAIVALLAPDSKFSNINQSVTPKNNYPSNLISSKPYFVMLSTIEPRKNHLLILQIFRKLAEQNLEDTPHLFIIGKRGWECEQICDLLDRSLILKKVVTEISNCQDYQLIDYIKNSQALLFPSFAEGYGLPLIEALALKTPVIASDLNVFKEIAGDIPEYIDALDAVSWQNTILEYTNKNSPKRNQQLQRLANFKIPSWTQHFKQVDEFIFMTDKRINRATS